MNAPHPTRHDPGPLGAVRRWLELEAAGLPGPRLQTVEAVETLERAVEGSFRALPSLAPRAGFARRVVALALAPGLAPAPAPAPAWLARWVRVVVAASLTLAGSAWLFAGSSIPAAAAVAGTWLRPSDWIDGLAFVLREGALVVVRAMSAWRILADVSDVLLRLATRPEALAGLALATFAAWAAMSALRGVLASERGVYRV